MPFGNSVYPEIGRNLAAAASLASGATHRVAGNRVGRAESGVG
jgi:hypothetical protein